MNSIYLITGLSALSVFLLVVGILGPLVRKHREINSKLEHSNNDLLQTPVGPAIALVADGLSTDDKKDKYKTLTRKLLLAGQPGGLSEGRYLYASIILATFAVFVFNFVAMFLIGGLAISTFIFPVIVSIGIYYISSRWVDSKIATRELSISREFPYFLDLSVMSMASGATLPQSIDTYVSENPTEPLAQELAILSREVSYGKTMLEALTDLDNRITSKGVNNALKAIMQGERMGMPLSDSLREQADTIRFSRSQDAEKLAEEMKIRMQGPAMLLLFSVLIVVLGPAFVQLTQGPGFG